MLIILYFRIITKYLYLSYLDSLINMTKLNQVYKCEICGNIVEVVHEAGGVLVCCGQPMKLLEENTIDASKEKHIPVIETQEKQSFSGSQKSSISAETKKGFLVKIGSIPHPMEEAHYIEWIEAVGKNGERCRKFLKPGDKPEAEFCFEVKEARELCNLHGLWKNS